MNGGATCYIAAAVQTVLRIPLMLGLLAAHGTACTDPGCIVCALREIAVTLESRDAAPSSVVDRLRALIQGACAGRHAHLIRQASKSMPGSNKTLSRSPPSSSTRSTRAWRPSRPINGGPLAPNSLSLNLTVPVRWSRLRSPTASLYECGPRPLVAGVNPRTRRAKTNGRVKFTLVASAASSTASARHTARSPR